MPSLCRQLGWWTLGVILATPLFAVGDDAPNNAKKEAEAADAVDVADFIVIQPQQAPPRQPAAPPAKAEKEKAPAANPAAAMLYLNDEDYFSGALRDCATPNTIHWQATGATAPFEFGIDAIRSAYFAPPLHRPNPDGEYCLELSDGDLLYGSVTAITKDEFEIDSSQFGHLKIARAEVQRIAPVTSTAFAYRGPNGLAEWTSDDIGKWREEAGRLVTNKRGANVKRSINIPEQARIEFEIAWDKSPQFSLAFAASDKSKQLAEGYRLEVWGHKLVLVREVSKSADVAMIGELDTNTAHVHLEAIYNHTTGEFLVKSLDGRELGRITLPKKGGYPLRVVSLTNSGKEISLEQLVVSQWNGRAAPKADLTKSRVHKTDNTIIYGDVTGYDADAKQFIADVDGKETRIDKNQVASIVQAQTDKPTKSAFRVGLHDGSRFSGELSKVENEKVYLERRGIDQPLACPLPAVRSLIGLHRAAKSAPYATHRTARWESTGIRSLGFVAPASPASTAPASCLVWKPRWSTTASPLRADASGRIIYRDAPPPRKTGEPEEAQPRPRGGVVWGAVTRVLGTPAPVRQSQMVHGAGMLCLLTGDRIPCESIRIDEEGVHFTSSTVAATFAPNRSVKALEFVPKWTPAALAEVKRSRLLTLPRMQKPSPPTHLVSSTAGDFLRCRLMAMDADSLIVEARLENKKLSRERVACIIWLHDLDGAKEPPVPANPPPKGLFMQAVQADGIRLTFTANECDGETIAGIGDIFGACRVRLNAVDQLILGSMVRETAEAEGYGDWKLHDAVEPAFAHEGPGAGAGANPGADSILLGKAAPDFKLDLLDGKHFKLSDQKGKVVVLDFWATWCGPCMQSMPEVDKLMQEFKDRGVKYVAVNAQEDQATVKSALERLKIDPAVALDIDGAAGERYQATAIPQIVVIDAEQKIADLIIGTNPGYIDQLRASIQKALDTKKP